MHTETRDLLDAIDTVLASINGIRETLEQRLLERGGFEATSENEAVSILIHCTHSLRACSASLRD